MSFPDPDNNQKVYQLHINHRNLWTLTIYHKKPRNQKLLFSNLERSAQKVTHFWKWPIQISCLYLSKLMPRALYKDHTCADINHQSRRKHHIAKIPNSTTYEVKISYWEHFVATEQSVIILLYFSLFYPILSNFLMPKLVIKLKKIRNLHTYQSIIPSMKNVTISKNFEFHFF